LKSVIFHIIFLFSSQILAGQYYLDSIVVKQNTIPIDFIQHQSTLLAFITLHHDEQTGIAAIQNVLKDSTGIYYCINTNSKRMVSINSEGKRFEIDPNRIFNLINSPTNYEDESHAIKQHIAKYLLEKLSAADLTIALHNNHNGGYSIKSYQQDARFKNNYLSVSINPMKDVDDFYIVTDSTQFNYFKKQHFNVVLQNNEAIQDDGSLSVFYGKNHRPFISIECQYGHLQQQIQMIKAVYGYYNTYFEPIENILQQTEPDTSK
jgi:hypothetical protein